MMLTGSGGLFAVLTLGSFALLAYAYVGYPALLWLLSKVSRARPTRAGEPTRWPSISIIVSAYNEEQVIGDRLRNLLALDYPPDRLEILVGSDGTTDRTAANVKACGGGAVPPISFVAPRGEATVLNVLLHRGRGDVPVMSGAQT